MESSEGVKELSQRKKIAAIISEYCPKSHADVIVTKFLKGFPTDEGLLSPRVDVVSMYIDQITDQDIGRSLAAQHGVAIYPSIVGSLTLGSTELAVDGVLLIAEQGDYAQNERQQKLYPRKYFMEQICGVFAISGRSVPVFNDKHLSYNWHDALWMAERARALSVPFMAGSSLPVCWRNPWLEHDLGTQISEALVVGFSDLDAYGFHALETLQCMVERRAGGETGVAAVTTLEGNAVWAAAEQGRWPRELAEASCACIEGKPDGSMQDHCGNPTLFLVDYRDGLTGTVLMLNGYIHDLAYAARVDSGVLQAAEFHLQGHGEENGPYAHFSYLALNVEEMFLVNKPMYPVERTLLTSGVLEAALASRHEYSRRIETPWLDVAYTSYEALPWRPHGTRPTGACVGS